MAMNRLASIILAWFMVTAVYADPASPVMAEDLFQSCSVALRVIDNGNKVRDNLDVLGCLSYIKGFLDTYKTLIAMAHLSADKTEKICEQRRVTPITATRVFVKYFQDHPEEADMAAFGILQRSLKLFLDTSCPRP